jgi:energy-coupling factor transport system permease protein
VSGGGLARLAHPFTPFVVALATVLLAFLLPGPWGPPALYFVILLLVAASGVAGAAWRGFLICLPLWIFLFILHGVLGDAPRIAAGPLRLSAAGLETAVAQAGRLGAAITVTLGLFESFAPSRFLDAVAVRGWSFSAAYLLVATLQAVPRLGARARTIVEAQRVRGLAFGRSPAARVRALTPLSLPLVLGAPAEVDERAIALDTRAVGSGAPRTALDPPVDSPLDRVVRWASVAAVAAAAVWRLAR